MIAVRKRIPALQNRVLEDSVGSLAHPKDRGPAGRLWGKVERSGEVFLLRQVSSQACILGKDGRADSLRRHKERRNEGQDSTAGRSGRRHPRYRLVHSRRAESYLLGCSLQQSASHLPARAAERRSMGFSPMGYDLSAVSRRSRISLRTTAVTTSSWAARWNRVIATRT